MAESLTWSFDATTNRTLRVLGWSQLVLVDAWVLLGTGLLLGSAVVPVEIGPVAGFVTVLLAIGRTAAWLDSDGVWLDGVERDLATIDSQLDARARFEDRRPAADSAVDALVGTVHERRRVLAPMAAVLAGVGAYAVGYALVGTAVVAVAAIAAIGGGLLGVLLDHGRARGAVDPDVGRVTYRGRSRSLSSITGQVTIPLGAITLLRCRGPAGLDEPTWLAVPTNRLADGKTALTTDPDGTGAFDDDGTRRGRWQHRFGPRLALLASGVSIVVLVVAFGRATVRPTLTTGLAAVAVVVTVATIVLALVLVLGGLRERARRQ
ncbi:hypothetical protein [Halovivax cerinus]|uniref:Uncharacterized protein n=1 Tax=Halovivax cerinus TaxID=1487865 RepID=A0ABD5NRL5_9EURY|nr:hypothetical protein [Halovivax cerinus]